MATMQDISGLLFGQGGSGLEDYLTPAQQKQIQQQGMLSAAAALLSASGTRPAGQGIGIGQALGGALQAGQQGYSQAQQGAIANLMARQKLAEAKRQEEFRKALQASQFQPQATGDGAVTTITPDQAIAAGGMPFGPTVQRAAMIGQEVKQPKMSQQDILYQDAINNYNIAKRYGYPEIASKYLDDALKIKPREEVTGDIFKSAGGEYVQRTKSGQFIPVSSQFAPIEKPIGAPIKVTDSTGKQVLVNMMSDGTYKTVEGFGPARELVQVDRGGVITFVDKDKVPAGTNLGKTLAPQVIGGAETGYYAIGGGMGGGVAPAPVGGQPPAVTTPPLGSSIMRQPQGQVVPPALPDSVIQPRATGLQPIIAGTGAKPTAEFMKASKQLNDLEGALKDYKTEIASDKWVMPKSIPLPFSDTGIPLPTGADTARVAGKYNSLLMGVKNLYELGALTGPDMSIIERQLTNPASWAGLLTSKNAMNEQVKILEDMLTRAKQNLSSSYRQTVPEASTAGIVTNEFEWKNGQLIPKK